MNADEVIAIIKQSSDPIYLEGMKRFGVDNSKAVFPYHNYEN